MRSLVSIVLVGSACSSSAAAVVVYTDREEWIRNSGITQPVGSTAGDLLHAAQVGMPPAPGASVGCHLDFGNCLPEPAWFSMTALQPSASFVFADTNPLQPAFADALSVGAAGTFTDDDLRFDFPGTTMGGEAIFAFGFTVRDNEAVAGETITVGGIGDVVLGVLPLPDCPGTSAFVGIVSDDPIAWIVVNESDDADDIAVGDFEMGSQLPPNIHYGLPEKDWEIHVGSFETLHTDAETVALAEELQQLPTPDAPIGPTLTFAKKSPLSRTIRLTALEENANWVFDDADSAGDVGFGFSDALSVGERDVHMHDVWQIEILDGPPVDGLAFKLGDSDDGGGECIEVYTVRDVLIATITPMPAGRGQKTFIGLHAHDEETIGRIVFHESPDSDDISVSEIRLAPAVECMGDLDEDGQVDGADVGLFLSLWGPCTEKHCHQDLNGDGTADAADLALLVAAWGACR
ncbi:MAG: hypothetical protein U0575_04070 [Phycisphaerales bacterium]